MVAPAGAGVAVGAGVPLASGASVGSPDGSVEGVTPSLGPGVRSGPVGSPDGAGAMLGTDPRPPVLPLHAATNATRATRAPARMRRGMGFMSRAPDVVNDQAPSIRRVDGGRVAER